MNKNLAGATFLHEEVSLKELEEKDGISSVIYFLTGQRSLRVSDVLNSQTGLVRLHVQGVEFKLKYCFSDFKITPNTGYPDNVRLIFYDTATNTMRFPELDAILTNTKELSPEGISLIVKEYFSDMIRSIFLCNIDKTHLVKGKGVMDVDGYKDTIDSARLVYKQIDNSFILKRLRNEINFLLLGLDPSRSWNPSIMAKRYLDHIGYGREEGIDKGKVLVELRSHKLMYNDKFGKDLNQVNTQAPEAEDEPGTEQVAIPSKKTRSLLANLRERVIAILLPDKAILTEAISVNDASSE